MPAVSLISLARLDDRLPSDAERDTLATYAKSIQARKLALLDIQRIELQAATYCVETTHKKYPRFVMFHQLGKEKGIRDMQLLLSAAAKTMLLNDLDYFNDQVLTWVRTIFRSLNFTPKFMTDTCHHLIEGVRKFAQPTTCTLVEPALNYMTQFLSDIPEPAVAEV